MEQIYNGEVVGEDIPAWKALETIISGWIRNRQWKEDLSNYQKIKEMYE